MFSARWLQQNIGTALSACHRNTSAVLESFPGAFHVLMRSMLKNLKVLWAVVILLAVAVMNKVFAGKAATDHLFRNKSMLKDVSSRAGVRMVWHLNEHISFFGQHAPPRPPSIRCPRMLRLCDMFNRVFPATILMSSDESSSTTGFKHRWRQLRVMHSCATTTSAGS